MKKWKVLLFILGGLTVLAIIGTLLPQPPAPTPAQIAVAKVQQAAAQAQEAAANAAKGKQDQEFTVVVLGAMELRKAMRNPASFQIALAKRMPKAVCYEYRSQNGFGGMNVGHAVMTNEALLTSGDAMLQAWDRDCAKQSGRDYTKLVNVELGRQAP